MAVTTATATAMVIAANNDSKSGSGSRGDDAYVGGGDSNGSKKITMN
jgi:hypothetical protein